MDDQDAPEPTGSRTCWGQWYVAVSLALLGLCLVAIWYYAGYRAQSFNEMLSFKIDDGWCVKGVQSIGQHCFGDYAGVDAGLRAGNFWNPALPTATAYPPLSTVPPIAFVYLGRATGSWTLGRDLFLLLLAGSILSPALWVSRKAWSDRGPVSFLIIGIASVPFLVILDRGNTAGLLVAPLLGLATAYVNERYRAMVVYIVICTVLKPQMLLLALLFIVYRRYAHLAVTVFVSVSLTFAGFLFFPGPLTDNVRNWLHMVRGYQVYQTFSDPYPYNLGAGRSILTLFDVAHLQSITGATARIHLGTWLQSHAGLLSGFLVVVTIAAMFKRRADSNLLYPLLAVCILIAIAPGTSFSYYLVLLLVPVAFVLRDPYLGPRGLRAGPQWTGILDRDDAGRPTWDRVARWALILGLACLLTPLVIPVSSVSWLASQVPAAEPIGVLQLLWGPILLVLFVLTISMTLLGSTRPPLDDSAPELVTREPAGAERDAALELSTRASAPASGE